MTASFKGLVEHHDALRLHFAHSSDSSLKATANYQDNAEFAIHSFEDEINLTQVQASIDLTHGVIGAVGTRSLNKQGELGQQSEILIAIHHLVVDALSWPVIIEDLAKLYNAYQEAYDTQDSSQKHHLNSYWVKRLIIKVTGAIP